MKSSVMHATARDLGTLLSMGAIGQLSDGQLLECFAERREADAFEVIVHRHGPMVWGVCLRVLRDRHDAEDAFQATFLVLARKAASVMPREKLGNWLYGVAYQTARKARAMRDKRRGREVQAPVMPEPMIMPHNPRNVATEALDRELSRLPEKYRIPIVLCDLEGKTHGETARQLGWPVGTVSSRLSRARTLLAKRLSQSGMILTVGSLAVHLAQDAASAGMPSRLVGPTARAASLFAAGGAATAGMVPAEVASLTEGVLKTMLLNKLKVVTVAALSVVTISFASIGLSYRARAANGSPQAKVEGKTAQLPADRVPGWRVRFDKAGKCRVTLDTDGTRITLIADAVEVDPDGSTAIRGLMSSMSRGSLEQFEELARLRGSRGVTAKVGIEFQGEGFRASFLSEMNIRVAEVSDKRAYIRGRPNKER